MIGFLIKKSFFDGWDNLIALVILNIGNAVTIGLIYLAILAGGESTVLTVLLILAVLFFASLYAFGTGGVTFAMSKYSRSGWQGFISGVKEHFSHVVLFWILLSFVFLCIFFVIPFYFSYGNFLGYLLTMFIVWAVAFVGLAIQYYIPLTFTMPADDAKKTLRKAFLILGDNLGVSLFMVLKGIIDLVFTLLTATLMPGLAGIQLSRMDAVKLFMLKYDYMEANPEVKKKDFPWEDVLYEEKELVGHRSLKNMIFPWKD